MSNRKKTLLYFFLGFILIALSVGIGIQEYRATQQDKRFLSFIDNVQAYQDSIDLKTGRRNYKDEIDSSTFSNEKYLQYFTKCKFPDSSTVKTFYLDNFLDGKPYILVMDTTQFNCKYKLLKKNSFRYKLHGNDSIHRLFYDFVTNDESRAKNNITPTNSKMGYLQYLFFHEFGEMFALKWHESYHEKEIITGDWKIDSIEKEIRGSHFVTDLDDLVMLKEQDFNPEIKLKKNVVEITLIERKHFSGIYRTTYQIMRKAPYKVLRKKNEKLMSIQSTIIF